MPDPTALRSALQSARQTASGYDPPLSVPDDELATVAALASASLRAEADRHEADPVLSRCTCPDLTRALADRIDAAAAAYSAPHLLAA